MILILTKIQQQKKRQINNLKLTQSLQQSSNLSLMDQEYFFFYDQSKLTSPDTSSMLRVTKVL